MAIAHDVIAGELDEDAAYTVPPYTKWRCPTIADSERSVAMWYKKFRFENYKGIKSLELMLDGDVTTLIGLNESGKTTILEAIFCFLYGAEDLAAIDPTLESLRDPEQWIPISQRGSFNGTISICAFVGLDEIDRLHFKRHMSDVFDLRLNKVPTELKITETYTFKASKLTLNRKVWSLDISGTTGKQRKPRSYGSSTREWQGAVLYLKTRLPRIWYFPNFLFELPERFELEGSSKAGNGELTDRDEFYKNTFERVIKQLDQDASLETHIIERIHSSERTDQRNLQSLLLDMSRKITTTVFDGWYRILGTKPAGQEVVIQHGSDSDSSAYLELKIRTDDGYFDLAERSLGFRWFFMFLFMTSFHEEARSTQKPLFLFDEPASNLHSSAQAELLKSFASLTERCHLVYSTHSHHMIDIRWLDLSYVVSNNALGNLQFDDYILNSGSSRTSISATRYRHFVSQNPTKLSYIQPVLDLLDYRPSTLEPIPDIVMVEGKIDFHLFRYMTDVIGMEPKLHFAPGTGAGSLDTLIRLYIAWAKNFIILLDSDKEGRDQKDRYERVFGVMVRGRIVSLGEVTGEASSITPERLLSDGDKERMVNAVNPESAGKSVTKKQLSNAIVELLASGRSIQIDARTKAQITVALENFQRRLESLGES
ncbi:ATP-dependent nuclease [Mycolicibacterium pulveris]|uniref:ATP-dependent nuclease n=1 Tax=Mycolicibacterium pulveris TaxID=36813 RepID=UPI003CF148D3